MSIAPRGSPWFGKGNGDVKSFLIVLVTRPRGSYSDEDHRNNKGSPALVFLITLVSTGRPAAFVLVTVIMPRGSLPPTRSPKPPVAMLNGFPRAFVIDMRV